MATDYSKYLPPNATQLEIDFVSLTTFIWARQPESYGCFFLISVAL